MGNNESDETRVIYVQGREGALKTPEWLADDSIAMTREFLAALDDAGSDPRVISAVVQRSWTMTNYEYGIWIADMIAYYLPVSQKLRFDHRAGVDHLIRLIQGLPSLRRRIPALDFAKESSLLLTSFALMRSQERNRQKYFYMALEEITLREGFFFEALCLVPPESQILAVDRLTVMIEAAGNNPLRLAEVEAALSGDQAAVLSAGAL